MKKYILIFVAFICSILHTHAVKRIEANPINVAVMLTEQLDSAAIASTCEYYGYVRQIPKDDYTIFTHPNGSVIRYKFENSDKKYSTIEVTAKTSQKGKDLTLKNLNFKKTGNSYERKSVGYTTRCTQDSHGTLILIHLPKSKQQ